MNIPLQYFLSVIILVASTYAVAAPPVVLEDDQAGYALGLHLDLLEDKAGQWTLADVMSAELADKFVVSTQEVPYFRNSKSVY